MGRWQSRGPVTPGRRHSARLIMGGLALALLAPLGVGSTQSAFSGTTDNASTLTASPDWTGPTVSPLAVASTVQNRPGHVYAGGTYQLYAQVADSGNPASGISSVTADLSNLTAGQTAATFTTSTYTLSGVSYNRRSASLTAGAGLTACSVGYTTTATDAAGNATVQQGTAMIDRDLSVSPSIRIDGEPTGGMLGGSVAAAGDVNGDGRQDAVVSAPEQAPLGKLAAGSTYVVFGQASPGDVDLASLGGGGFRIDGATGNDNSGGRSRTPGTSTATARPTC